VRIDQGVSLFHNQVVLKGLIITNVITGYSHLVLTTWISNLIVFFFLQLELKLGKKLRARSKF